MAHRAGHGIVGHADIDPGRLVYLLFEVNGARVLDGGSVDGPPREELARHQPSDFDVERNGRSRRAGDRPARAQLAGEFDFTDVLHEPRELFEVCKDGEYLVDGRGDMNRFVKVDRAWPRADSEKPPRRHVRGGPQQESRSEDRGERADGALAPATEDPQPNA